MKKAILLFGAVALFLTSANTFANSVNKVSTVISENWVKSTDNVWKGKTMFFKMVPDGIIVSPDGSTWRNPQQFTPMWETKSGALIKKDGSVLKTSADNGTTWTTMTEMKWEAPDGTWYKFDSSWNLWLIKVASNTMNKDNSGK